MNKAQSQQQAQKIKHFAQRRSHNLMSSALMVASTHIVTSSLFELPHFCDQCFVPRIEVPVLKIVKNNVEIIMSGFKVLFQVLFIVFFRIVVCIFGSFIRILCLPDHLFSIYTRYSLWFFFIIYGEDGFLNEYTIKIAYLLLPLFHRFFNCILVYMYL